MYLDAAFWKVYENALVHELSERGLSVKRQYGIPVFYDGIMIGEYVADVRVEDVVLVELNAVTKREEVYLAQCRNYLKATHRSLCPLLNFGSPRVEVKRVVL